MKLYALRDRLIGYYLQPFTGFSDDNVKASLAETINGENSHALTKSPHHFELFALAEIDQETGVVVPKVEFLCECTALVRHSGGSSRRSDGGDRGVGRSNTGGAQYEEPPPGRSGTPYGGERIVPAQGSPASSPSSTEAL